MIYLYRGHILLGVGLLWSGLLGLFVWGFMMRTPGNDAELIYLLAGVFVSGIMTLLLLTFAYTHWVPKWERDEKRTGHIPGEKEKK